MCCGHFSHIFIPLSTTLSQATNQPLRPVEVEPQVRCPTCSSATSPEFVWCPKCGATLKAHPCVYCGQAVTPEDKSCSFCGAPLKESQFH